MPTAAIPIAAAVAGGLASSALSSALAPSGPDIPLSQPGRGIQKINLKTPNFNFSSNPNGNVSLTPTAASQSLLDTLTNAGNVANQGTQALLDQVQPGFGALTKARVDAIHNAALKSTSDLRGNLARRRVLGSSFGQNAVAQVTQQAGVDEANARAQSFLEEMDATNKLIQQQFTNASAVAHDELSQLNTESSQAINLINGTQQVFQDNASVIGQLAAANAQGSLIPFSGALDATNSGVSGLVNSGLTSLLGSSSGSSFIPSALSAGAAGIGG